MDSKSRFSHSSNLLESLFYILWITQELMTCKESLHLVASPFLSESLFKRWMQFGNSIRASISSDHVLDFGEAIAVLPPSPLYSSMYIVIIIMESAHIWVKIGFVFCVWPRKEISGNTIEKDGEKALIEDNYVMCHVFAISSICEFRSECR